MEDTAEVLKVPVAGWLKCYVSVNPVSGKVFIILPDVKDIDSMPELRDALIAAARRDTGENHDTLNFDNVEVWQHDWHWDAKRKAAIPE